MKKKSDQNLRTPPWLFNLLKKELRLDFTLDAAACKRDALCKRYYTKRDNGLEQRWYQPTFYNPPFKKFGDWITKAFEESSSREIVTCGIGPVGCSQKWFHEYAKHGIIFAPDQRISFFSRDGKPTRGADRDTMIYVFGPGWWNSNAAFGQFLIESLHVRGLVVTKKVSE